MKATVVLSMLAFLTLAACYVAPGDAGTSLGAYVTVVTVTDIPQAADALTPAPAVTPKPGALMPDELTVEPPTPGLAGAHDTKALPPDTPSFGGASLTVAVDLNVRTGPGTHYDRIGWLATGTTVGIIGRSPNGDWWQIPYPDAPNGEAWVSEGYGIANNVEDVPVVVLPPTPTPFVPTATPTVQAPPPPSPPPSPSYQYTPTGWWGDTNYGLTRFLGEIRDTAGNPVNGVFVRATCGDYATISYPSGPVGWGPFGESSDWPPGFYDITVEW